MSNSHNVETNTWSSPHYKIPISSLQSIFDPKSLRNFIKIGGLKNVVADLNTDINTGLPIEEDLNDANTRVQIYGKNKLPLKIQKSFFKLCWEVLQDQVLIILSISAVVSLLLGLYETFYQPPEYDENGKPLPKIQWVDGFAILLAVLIVVLVGALNDYNKEKQFMKLNNKKEDRQIIVYRSNEKLYISIYDLLVGDLLYVETGDVLPADCILVSGECSSDESSVTGESKTIDKSKIVDALEYFNDEVKSLSSSTNLSVASTSSSYQFDVGDADNFPDPFLVSGSKLLSGQGRALVICVGENSVNGKIMMSLTEDDEEDNVTPLQERLNALADGISKYGFMAAVSLFFVLLIKSLVQFSTVLKDLPLANKLSKLISIVITAITVVVVAIPEGLPLAVTLALAFATTKMTEDGNLVRVLKSCETMGAATAICSDKTGTLTINKMSVVKGLFDYGHIFTNAPKSTNDSFSSFKLCANNLASFLLNNIVLNSTAFENTEKTSLTQMSMNKKHKSSSWFSFFPFNSNDNLHLIGHEPEKDLFVGSKTECALLNFVREKCPLFYQKMRSVHEYRSENEDNIVKVIPFESDLKWSGIVYCDPESKIYTFFIKGAAEIILRYCDSILLLNGKTEKLSDSQKKSINEIRESFAKQALRAISLAHYTFDDHEASKINWDELTAVDLIKYPLVLDMTVGIQDPLRPGVREAIAQCHRAGVDVRMVTGDNVLTARAISRDCGILSEENFNNKEYYMEGPEFRRLTDEERIRILPKLHILARSSPTDKRILVEALKEMGEVVAVTGDGTNDAPALRLADVGFSMGLSGTEVAREASDIVLMSDDFSSIVNAIKWGRTVSASIKKFVQFQLTVNFTAVILTFVSSIMSDESSSVLTAVQLLWVNLIMDTLAALALATDKPDDDVLDSKPEGRNTQMISFNMWKMILGMSTLQLIITMLFNFHGAELFFGVPFHDLKVNEKMMLKTMVFNTFVWMQIFTLFVSRILNQPEEITCDSSLMDRLSFKNIGFFRHLERNYWFIGITGLISIMQVLIMIYGGAIFSIVPIPAEMWFVSLFVSSLMLPFGVLLRIIPDQTIASTLPLHSIMKVIKCIEWFLFGCGMMISADPNSSYRPLNTSPDDLESGNATSGNIFRDTPTTNTNTTTFSNRNVPEIILNETPSPMLDASQTGENHKLSKLSAVLQ